MILTPHPSRLWQTVAPPSLTEETIDSDAFTEWAVCVISDKTWMHTPEALAKHYIPYNAKVCCTIVWAFWTVKQGETFCCSTKVGGFYSVQTEPQKYSVPWFMCHWYRQFSLREAAHSCLEDTFFACFFFFYESNSDTLYPKFPSNLIEQLLYMTTII